MSRDPTDTAALLEHEDRAEDFLHDHAYAQALAEADKALALDGRSLSALLVRAQAAKALGRFDDAIETMEAVLKIANLAPLRVNLANIYVEMERHAKAEEHLLLAIQADPMLVEAHASLGSVHMRVARYDRAEPPTRQALALDPYNMVANQNLIAILASRGELGPQANRDNALPREQVLVERAFRADAPVALVLSSGGPGNVPYQHLLPRAHYGRVLWFLEQAQPGQAVDLPRYDFVFNAVGDPDAAPRSQAAAATFVQTCSAPLINRPDRVARTLRSTIGAVIGAVPHLRVPGVRRFLRDEGDLVQAIAASGLRFPLIVRPAGRHGGEGAVKVEDVAGLAAAIPAGADAVYATEFVNYRANDGLYRKYRVIFVDRMPYPYHLAIGDHWLVHYWTSDMETNAGRRDEEARFLDDPQGVLGSRAWDTLKAVAQAMDLDYAGMDFSLLPDGDILFFEANATMLVHPEDEEMFAYKASAVQAILAATSDMICRRLDR